MFAPTTPDAGAQGAKTPNNSKYQHWERLYRAALLGSDRTSLLQRIADAEASMLDRAGSLSRSAGDNRKEQEVITRALHILGLLREAEREP